MGFKHRFVSKVKQSTDKYLNRLAEDTGTEIAENTTMFDGIRMRRELADVCTEIRKTNRHVKFGVQDLSVTQNGHKGFVCQVWMYYDEDMYAMGRIGVPTYSGDAMKYYIYAPTIKNKRYRHGDDMYTAASEKLATAVKNVRKYVRKYSPVDVANISRDDFAQNLDHKTWSVGNKVRDCLALLQNKAALMRELKHLRDIGHKFVDTTYEKYVDDALLAMVEETERANHSNHAWHVTISETEGNQAWTVVEVLDLRHGYFVSPDAKTTRYAQADVPAELMEKVAALNMLEDNHYVDGLGKKINDRLYWVIR